MNYYKGFIAPLLLALIALILIGGGTYVYTQKKQENPPVTGNVALPQATSTIPATKQTTATTQAANNKIFSETEILSSLKNNWPTTQALISFRPTYHNQVENTAKIWLPFGSVQFIGRNNIFVRFEDDNNASVAVFHFDGSKFSLLETFKNQSNFTQSDWGNLVVKYGDSSYSVSTYTADLVRNGQIVSFQVLTKVPENVFVTNYPPKKI